MAKHNEIGRSGEEAAVQFLIRSGHQLMARNYRSGKAEIDIITRVGQTMIFSEVKTRTTTYAGLPELSVDKRKQKLMVQAASAYVHEMNWDGEIRFDIVSITFEGGKMQLELIEDAFFPVDEGYSEK